MESSYNLVLFNGSWIEIAKHIIIPNRVLVKGRWMRPKKLVSGTLRTS